MRWLWLLLVCAGCGGTPLLYEGRGAREVAPVDMHLVRVFEDGVPPDVVEGVRNNASGVVFSNELVSRPITVVIPASGLETQSSREGFSVGFVERDGVFYTEHPIAPGGLASLCVCSGEEGSYEVEFLVYGVRSTPLRGRLRVDPEGVSP